MVEKPSKTFKRVKRQREEEFTPPHDPSRPFNRQYQKSRMPWQLEVIRRGRWDVLAVYILFWVGLIAVILFGIYVALSWCANVILPVLFPPGVIKIPWL